MSSSVMPVFSVIVPAFGGEDALRRALRSCAAQTFGDFEVIVVDDHSPVALQPILDAENDARFIAVRNARNLGAGASRNVGISVAKGRYIVFIDADDVMLPTRLETVAAHIGSEPDLVLHRQFRVFDPRRDSFAYEILPRASIAPSDDLAAFTFRNGNFYNMNTFAVSRSLLRRTSFRDGMRLYEDQAFIFDCYGASRHTVVLDAALSVYMDDDRDGRASRRFRDTADLTAFLDYARGALSPTAISYIDAAIRSERGDGFGALGPSLVRAWRSGLPLKRALYYVVRRLIGQNAAEMMRARSRRRVGTQPLPVWVDSL